MSAIVERLTNLVLARRAGNSASASATYRVIDRASAERLSLDGWHDDDVAAAQERAYEALLDQMRAGRPRCDLAAAAAAIRRTGIARPTLLEVGCGSGYYAEVLTHLLDGQLDYTGLDDSPAMIRLARQRRGGFEFVEGNATRLPFDGGRFDIVFNGVSLMHVVAYERAIAEAARVAGAWCIFHSVPLRAAGPTVFLTKLAYGQPTVEIIFNRAELAAAIETAGLVMRHEIASVEYNVEAVVGERTATWTLVCEKVGRAVTDVETGRYQS